MNRTTENWLNPGFAADWISSERPGYSNGLFIVRWEGEQESVQTDGGESAVRIRRLLSTLALRSGKLSDSVKGWTLSDSSLIMAVAVGPDETGDGSDDREITAGRMAFLLRDLAIRAFSTFRYSRNDQKRSSIRIGFGWIAPIARAAAEPDRHPAQGMLRAEESALLAAYETAWQRMFFASNPIRLPLAGYPQAYMAEPDYKVKYLPIVSLMDGSLYGFEAVAVKAHNGARIGMNEFYEKADRAGQLFEADRRFREAAIRGFPSRNGDVKLFLPVPAKIIFDPRLYPGSTLRRIEAANLRPEHVVLVIFGGEQESASTIRSALKHYRDQGFRISMSGIKPQLESLRGMKDMQPDYAHMNVDWMSGQVADPIEESFLQALIGIARKEQIVFIASGLDSDRLLPGLVSSGMNYAQGDWLNEGHEDGSSEPLPERQERIRNEVNKRFQGATGTMSELINPVKQFKRDTPVSEVSRHFELHREAQGVVIADGGKPIGLLMKEKLLQLLSGQFGLPLYWNRPVGKIMDAHPMVIEESVTVDQASQMAMAREPDKLYDEVVITRDGAVAGIASIRSMLEWISQSRVKDAQWANPLSGLPGNEPIRREMVRRIAAGRPFEVLYADLDHFKWYNDMYGFQRGDDVIRYTAETLAQTVRARPNGDCFVGHIGGDDFIVLSSGVDALQVAQDMLRNFEQGVGSFALGHTGLVADRSGRLTEAPALSLSLSLILCRKTAGCTPETLSERAALLKKKAKQLTGNSIAWEELGESEGEGARAPAEELTAR